MCWTRGGRSTLTSAHPAIKSVKMTMTVAAVTKDGQGHQRIVAVAAVTAVEAVTKGPQRATVAAVAAVAAERKSIQRTRCPVYRLVDRTTDRLSFISLTEKTDLLKASLTDRIVKHTIAQTMTQTIPHTTPHIIPQPVPQTIYQTVPQPVPQTISQTISQTVPQTISQTIPHTYPHTVIPPTIPPTIPQTTIYTAIHTRALTTQPTIPLKLAHTIQTQTDSQRPALDQTPPIL